jgi:hypothetical protein
VGGGRGDSPAFGLRTHLTERLRLSYREGVPRFDATGD